MFYKTFICFYVSEAKPLCFSHCSRMFEMLNDVEYATFKMIVNQMSNYLFVISFQLMFYKTVRYRLARDLCIFNCSLNYCSTVALIRFLFFQYKTAFNVILATSSQTFYSYFPLFNVDHLKIANCSLSFILWAFLGKHCV